MGFFGGGGGGTGVMLHERVVLDDAEIRALPTARKNLVTLASGHKALPIAAFITLNNTAGAYTNNGGIGRPQLTIDPDNFLVSSSTTFNPALSTPGINLGWIFAVTDGNDQPLATLNEISFSIDNGGLGDYTGGNAANTLTVDLYYFDVAP